MRTPRWLTLVAGVILLAFGLGCLNYTRAEGLEHHRAWARAHGMPAPRPQIFLMGVASALVGAGAIGYNIGARKATPS